MAFEQWDKFMVCDEGISNVEVCGKTYGFEFCLQYPTYRGTYLSCIEKLDIAVDGEDVNPDDVEFHVNGKQFMLHELKDLFAEYWFILDHAVIRIVNRAGFPKGSKHTVKVTMKHRIPYTGYFGEYMTPVSVCTKDLTVL